jgi:hypothetical protein
MKIIKLPSPTRLIFGSLGAFWLAVSVNPGFSSIGIMILLLIPVLIFELLYPKNELDDRLVSAHSASAENTVSEKSGSTELVSKDS